MRIALAQFAATTDPAVNLELVQQQIALAGASGVRLVVFPEAMSCSFARPRIEAAEPLSGAWAEGVRSAAEDAGVTVVVGLFTPGSAGRVRNTLLVTGGGVDIHYDKIHLFDAYGYAESAQVEPGDRLITVVIDGITFGLATCYDIRFPAQFTALAGAGAQIMLVPASWAPGEGKVEQWRTLVAARALDTTSIVVAVGQARPSGGPDAGLSGRQPTGVGHSIVAGPLGEVLVELGPDPELRVVELDVEAVARARAVLPVLVNGRFSSTLD